MTIRRLVFSGMLALFTLVSSDMRGLMIEEIRPRQDTVHVGIYIMSIYDIDFKQSQYSINLWLWLKHKNPEFKFDEYLEVPMAKSFEKEFVEVDTLEDGSIYTLMKLQCVMRDYWKIGNFPFDHQRLMFWIENSQFESKDLIFKAETWGEQYSPYLFGPANASSWDKDSLIVRTDIREYKTNFNFETFDTESGELMNSTSQYARYNVSMIIHRDSWELFLKLFIGMYISFMIAFICFFIHVDHIDSRLALSVGALFAVIGNKYIIDSALPESNSFTLVDSLHGVTMFCIFLVMVTSVITLNLIKKEKTIKAYKYNRRFGWSVFLIFTILNVVFIVNSRKAGIAAGSKPEPFETRAFFNKANTDKGTKLDTLLIENKKALK